MLNENLQQLRDSSEDIRSAALRELMKLGKSGTLSIDDAVVLIRAAQEKFPSENEWEDVSASLLYVARDIARDNDPSRLLSEVESVFVKLSPGAKQGALQVVTLAHTEEGARVYLRLIQALGNATGEGSLPTFEPSAGEAVARVLFPSIIAFCRDRNLAYPVFSMLLAFRQKGLVAAEVCKEHHGSIAAVLKGELAQARALQRDSGLGWKDEPPYAEHRDFIGLIFDLAGHLNSKTLLNVVAQSGDLLDPRLRRFRAVTLLAKGINVADTELDWIARSPRDRYWLFEQLRRTGAGDRLPRACLDQQLLAEGHMVDWLCFPTELGREPDEIVLFAKESRPVSTGPRLLSWLKKREMVDYYFFRFRVTEEHWAKERGWTVGMAGGYARASQPTTSHDGGTFSTFGAWEEKSPAEHIADYLR